MDYIREELLRQRAAWAALLLGRPVQETVEAKRQEQTEYAMEREIMTDYSGSMTAHMQQMRQMWQIQHTQQSAQIQQSEWIPATAGAAAWDAETLRRDDMLWDEERSLLRERRVLPAGERGRLRRNRMLRREAAERNRPAMQELEENERFAAELYAGEAAPEERVQVTVLQPERGPVQSAKQLSRIYQRDARRYDGAFSLY